jgi:hypothetical protein
MLSGRMVQGRIPRAVGQVRATPGWGSDLQVGCTGLEQEPGLAARRPDTRQ